MPTATPTPVGIRREEKKRVEKRAPLVPAHIKLLIQRHGLSFVVQPSEVRAIPDHEYAEAGASLSEDLSSCGVILGVKEISPELIAEGKVHCCFSHVIKGQPENMPALRAYMNKGATLVDYEKITDSAGRRLVFFSVHAGYAGALEVLWALGKRLELEGYATPLASLKRPFEYESLDAALKDVARVGSEMRRGDLPEELFPLVIGLMGGGNVAAGVWEVLSRLAVDKVEPGDLPALAQARNRHRSMVYVTVFRRHHRLMGPGGVFDEDTYRSNPSVFQSAMHLWLPYLTALINAVYWEPGLPKLITREQLAKLTEDGNLQLRVIGDITCDIGGSVEITVRPTTIAQPVYTYDPTTGSVTDGIAEKGVQVMAVDNLPCEFPREASQHFGDQLFRFVPQLASAKWDVPFEKLELPQELLRAVVVHKGELTPAYRYLERYLEKASGG